VSTASSYAFFPYSTFLPSFFKARSIFHKKCVPEEEISKEMKLVLCSKRCQLINIFINIKMTKYCSLLKRHYEN
jgi:hypothetical protein